MISPVCSTDLGSISISASGGAPPLKYSVCSFIIFNLELLINWVCHKVDGVTFSSDHSTFDNLGSGDYDPIISDNNGCSLILDTVTISVPDGINNLLI